MSFLIDDLPAAIIYDDDPSMTLCVIEDMKDVDWVRGFTVVRKNIDIQALKNNKTAETSVIPVRSDHWLKDEVENYYISIAPFKGIPFTEREREKIVEAIKRALQWSTVYGTAKTVDPTAILYNVYHQLFGVALKEIHKVPEMELQVSENDTITLNRYLITYIEDGISKDHICYSPNAELARFEFMSTCAADVVIESINSIQPIDTIESTVGATHTYVILHRLRHKANLSVTYYKTELETTWDVHLEFMNKYPETVIHSLKRLVNDKTL